MMSYMKRSMWPLVILALLFTILIDQYTKTSALSKPETWYGPLHIILVHNQGAFLGLFSDLPEFLRIVMLSTSGIFILSVYLFIQHILPVRIMKLRIGLALLIGGILGNVVDRIKYGYVIDFISFEVAGYHSPVWNVADMIQWVGYILMSYSLIKEGHLLWPDKNARLTFWINKRFQVKYAAIFISTGLLLALLSFVFSFTYLRMSLIDLTGVQADALAKYTTTFIYAFIVIVLIFVMFLFSISKYISHHIAGPVYAFERYLNQLLDSRPEDTHKVKLKLRNGDDFKHLEKVAERIKEKVIPLKENQKSKSDPNP